jgi:hypothetical protein
MLAAASVLAQTMPAAATAESGEKPAARSAASEVPATEIQPDRSDAGVIRAQQNLDRVRALVQQGAMPMNNLTRAQDELQDALDMSILRYSAFTRDLLPEQADQMVTVAQRMLIRRQQRVIQARQLAANGVISRAEAEASGADEVSARLDLDLAMERARLAQELAQSLRLQKTLAEAETDAETHPELNGGVYTRFDGNGTFTRADFDKISQAFFASFGHVIPVSADGQTAVHRSMGFNHTGRIDIALSPDQPEGKWLLRFLEKNQIPYFAFRAAVAHKATGAHIHLGPGSTKLIASLH